MKMADTNYKRLGRNAPGHHGLRNFSSFFLLLSAIVLFSLVYLYFSTSSELQSFRTDYEDLNSQNLKLKNDLLDANVKLESAKKNETECRNSKNSLNNKYGECQKELEDKRTSLTKMEGNKNDCDGIVKQLNGSLESFKKQLEEKITLVKNLTETVEGLKKELEMAHMNPSAILQQLTQFSTSKNDAPSPSINPFSPLEQPKEATKKMEENKDPTGSHHHPPMDLAAEKADADDGDSAHEKQQQQSAMDFIAPKQSPGGRVHLAEQAAQQEKLSNHRDLLKAAAKLDKQQEEDADGDEADEKENADMELAGDDEAKNKNTKEEEVKVRPTESKPTTGGTIEKNRPLVDALHGIIA